MDPVGPPQATERTRILAPQINIQYVCTESEKNDLVSKFPGFVAPEGNDEGPTKAPPGVPGVEDPFLNKSSMTLTCFNYINSIVGSGVVGMSYALHQAGLGAGLVLLVLVAGLTDTSLVLMIKAGQIADVRSYQDLARAAFGKTGFIVQTFLQFLYPFIALISYNIIVGDTVTKVLIRVTGISERSVLVRREFIVTTSTLLITLPISLYRNISRLARISLLSIFLLVVIAVAMLVRLHSMIGVVPVTSHAWSVIQPNFPAAIGIISFAFMCHHSSFMMYNSLLNNTQDRWNKATHISICASAMLSLIIAVTGYVTFTGYVQGDIFENYCWRDDLMNICRGLYAITILLTFPIECFVARDVMDNAFFGDYQPQPIFRHASLTVIIAIIGMLLSLTTDCLGLVLEFNGILCAMPLAYILPPLCYIRLEEGAVFSRKKWVAWCLVVFGALSVFFGVITLLVRYSSLDQCSHGKQMPYCFRWVNGTPVPLLF